MKFIAAPVPLPPQPIRPAFSSGPSGALSSMTGRITFAFGLHDVISEGTIIPAAPAAAAVPRKFLLEIGDFFITVLCMK
jgi:hypothetical protein